MRKLTLAVLLLALLAACSERRRGRRGETAGGDRPTPSGTGSQGFIIADTTPSQLPEVTAFIEQGVSAETYTIQAPDPLSGGPGNYRFSWLAEYPLNEVTLSGIPSLELGEHSFGRDDGFELLIDYEGMPYRFTDCGAGAPRASFDVLQNANDLYIRYQVTVCSPAGESATVDGDIRNVPLP